MMAEREFTRHVAVSPGVGAGLALPSPDIRQRSETHASRSIRLRSYDYSTVGAYFFTVVTLERICRFGDIRGDEAVLNGLGDAVVGVWNALPQRFAEVELDAFVVMPNHVHGIIWLIERDDAGARALGDVIGAFKSLSTRELNHLLSRSGAIWQRNYFEPVVRNERELDAIRRYVDENPSRWALDHENPNLVLG
jgi:REP-associated tyrosine transposase